MSQYTEFVCNCREDEMAKIARLESDVKFGPAGATQGYSAYQNMKDGLIGVYRRPEPAEQQDGA